MRATSRPPTSRCSPTSASSSKGFKAVPVLRVWGCPGAEEVYGYPGAQGMGLFQGVRPDSRAKACGAVSRRGTCFGMLCCAIALRRRCATSAAISAVKRMSASFWAVILTGTWRPSHHRGHMGARQPPLSCSDPQLYSRMTLDRQLLSPKSYDGILNGWRPPSLGRACDRIQTLHFCCRPIA